MRSYDYIKINDYYFCLQQNPAVFAWILFFKRDDLITIQPWLKKDIPRWAKTYLKYQWNLLKKNVFNLIIFTQCRLGLRKMDKVVLPVYGHFGMHVHRGYKIFHLNTNIVTKIFDSDVEVAAIKKEVEQLKMVSNISYAPSLIKWDIDERWYQEEYVRSSIASDHRSSDSDIFLQAYYKETVPCLKTIMSYKPAKTIKLGEYLNEIFKVLDSADLFRKKLTDAEHAVFESFIGDVTSKLKMHEDTPVNLVFSHGDFCPANILSTEKGIKFIDWESAGYRSLLFDFYSYFFHRPVSSRFSVEQLISEIDNALPHLLSELPFISDNADSIKIYRQLYYLEQLYKLAERDVTDTHLSMKDYAMRYISSFKSYEDILSQAAAV